MLTPKQQADWMWARLDGASDMMGSNAIVAGSIDAEISVSRRGVRSLLEDAKNTISTLLQEIKRLERKTADLEEKVEAFEAKQ